MITYRVVPSWWNYNPNTASKMQLQIKQSSDRNQAIDPKYQQLFSWGALEATWIISTINYGYKRTRVVICNTNESLIFWAYTIRAFYDTWHYDGAGGSIQKQFYLLLCINYHQEWNRPLNRVTKDDLSINKCINRRPGPFKQNLSSIIRIMIGFFWV